MSHLSNNKKREKGAIIVEATLVLPFFMFAIIMILSIVDICYVQAKMGVAINAAAKEMSQYGYLYTTLHLDEHMSGEGGKSSEIMDSLSEILNSISQETKAVSSELSSLFGTVGNVAGGDSAAEYIKDGVGQELAKKLIEKNLVTHDGDTAEAFLRRNHVVDGIDGLNFLQTSFLSNAEQDEVDIVVSYQISVIKLLNLEYKFTFVQRAKSKVWGRGVTKIKTSDAPDKSNGTSIWEEQDVTYRGEYIVEKEREKYDYTSKGKGFDAYDPDNNEFIHIFTVDTTDGKYADPDEGAEALSQRLKSEYSKLYSNVGMVQDTVTVIGPNGEEVIVDTPKEGRTYKMVLVVPDDADLDTIKAVVAEFEQERAELGDDVEVEIRTGYGDSKPDEVTES